MEKTEMSVIGVIMAGGGGTRFWPLSRKTTPKQLLNLSGKGVMINEAVGRLMTVTPGEKIYIVTNEIQTDRMKQVLGGSIPEENILVEPTSRNTAACIGYAAVKIIKKYGDGIMAITPSDAYIRDTEEFTNVLQRAISAAQNEDKPVTIGITPTFPATGYGYILHEKTDEPVKKVLRFVEKPSLRRAKEYVASGEYVWNSGMFIWKASVILEKFRVFLPELHAGLMRIYEALGTERETETIKSVYPGLTSVSVDYGIMEKCKDILVVPGDFGWSDVGSWDMLGALHTADRNGNIVVGDGVALETSGCIIYAHEKPVATIGIKDLVIVDTPDAILVCPKSRAQDVKKIVDELKDRGREELL